MYSCHIAERGVHGMTKRITSFVLSVMAMVSFCVSVNAAEIEIRGVDVSLPEAYIEINKDINVEDIDKIELGDKKLTPEKAHKDASKVVYMLIDTSTSMSQNRLNSLKPSLIKYAKSLGDDDKFVLMTFGKKVETLLNGGESDSKIESTINSITCNSGGTSFYLAIDKAFDKAQKETEYIRKYAIVVSDGADYETGSMSKEELLDVIDTHKFPVYGMCDSNAGKTAADNFGEICRKSGGELVKFGYSDAANQFSSLKKIFNNVTVIEATAKTKKSFGETTLTVEIDGKSVEANVDARAANDDIAPVVESITYEKESNSFIIKFSEPVEGYKDITISKNKGKKEIAIVDRQYNTDECDSIKLVSEKKLYTGEYTFDLSSVTDMTDNKNALENEVLTEKVEATSIIWKVILIVGIVLIPVAFLLALYFVLLNLKKKKQVTTIKQIFETQEQVVEEKQVHIVSEKPTGYPVNFTIIKSNGKMANANFKIQSSLFVGRSDMCELCIDDSRLSSQHLVFERVETGLSVMDLGSTNGTYVNGIQIHSKTFVRSGDKVAAGNTVIIPEYK